MTSDVCAQKSDVGRGLQNTCELRRIKTKEGPMSRILKHLCGLETCPVIKLLQLLHVFENPGHAD